MIAEIRFKNMFSFRDEAILSFEADRSKDTESYHVVDFGAGVRLLKIAVIYGANASGKSNIIKVCDFIKSIQIVPFLLNKTSSRHLSEYSISFYLKNKEKTVRYVYSVALDRWHVAKESLIYYPSQQPATIFERNTENNVSRIKFGQKIKMSQAVKEAMTLKCLHNMSVFSAYMQVNTHIAELETVFQYLTNQVMPAIVSVSTLNRYAEESIKNESAKDYILRYLQKADFNISNITSKEQETQKGLIKYTMYQHRVLSEDGNNDYYEFPELLESDGTVCTFSLAAQIQKNLEKDAFLAVDNIEFSLHPKLIEHIIECFLKESEQAQLLVTTHYDGLLGEEDC